MPDYGRNLDRLPLNPAVPKASGSADAWRLQRLRQILIERARRKIEGVRLYAPLLTQAQFHHAKAAERIVRGSNRSGKTLCAAVEVARAVTGRDPDKKYPLTDGRAFCVAKDEKEVGQVMYRKLFRAGSFRIIRDPTTKAFRAYQPWNPWDAQNLHLSKPAPPLIPQRFVKSIAWKNKAASIPALITLANGWELSFFTSNAKPPHGSDIDLAWFDEEILDGDWYPEISARLLDRSGKFIWSATPQAGTDQLYELHDRALAEQGKPKPMVEEFVITLAGNPHVSEENKRAFAAKLSEEDHHVRVEGEFLVNRYRVYPNYSAKTHGVDPFPVPSNWTRYAAIDPGRQVCAVLFLAVPPPEEWDWLEPLYIYDELYLRNCDAETFGQAMARKVVDQDFEDFLIDHRGSRVTDVGGGRSVEVQYQEALKRHKVRCRRTGSGFTWGSDDVEGGVEAVRDLLRLRRNPNKPDEEPRPRLLVFRGTLKNFDNEIKRYHNKRNAKGEVTDKPEDRNAHLMDCLRYLAMHRPKYRSPVPGQSDKNLFKAYLKWRERKLAKKGQDRMMLGPNKRRD